MIRRRFAGMIRRRPESGNVLESTKSDEKSSKDTLELASTSSKAPDTLSREIRGPYEDALKGCWEEEVRSEDRVPRERAPPVITDGSCASVDAEAGAVRLTPTSRPGNIAARPKKNAVRGRERGHAGISSASMRSSPSRSLLLERCARVAARLYRGTHPKPSLENDADTKSACPTGQFKRMRRPSLIATYRLPRSGRIRRDRDHPRAYVLPHISGFNRVYCLRHPIDIGINRWLDLRLAPYAINPPTGKRKHVSAIVVSQSIPSVPAGGGPFE